MSFIIENAVNENVVRFSENSSKVCLATNILYYILVYSVLFFKKGEPKVAYDKKYSCLQDSKYLKNPLILLGGCRGWGEDMRERVA